jgi:hypothetical protein
MRQAVVVIHGIGEQRPMDTVRGFVDAVMPQPLNPKKPKFWSKPDPLSELFELRKLTTPQSRSMPPTDFYEYYWAYQAEGTKVVHVISWAWALLVRRPKDVPKHLEFLWYTLWSLILATAGLMAAAPWATKTFRVVNLTIKDNYLLSALTSLALLVISGFIVNYVGDAARYLNPSPTNIEMRRRIREEGIKLLKKLHEPLLGYNRIIVVGHSLGSVIAYDIVKNLWPQSNTKHACPDTLHQESLHQLEKTGKELQANATPQLAEQFRDEQGALWHEERGLEVPWLVTDLITAGSPLAHAELLLARTRQELHDRQQERELPTCPPVQDDGSYSYRLDYSVSGMKRSIYALHHGAPFACTRWTNLYFPAALGFFGDLVGGPLSGVFGQGVRDVAVDSAEWGGWLKHTPLIHTHYWSKQTVPPGKQDDEKTWALNALRTALALESRMWLKNSQGDDAEEKAKSTSA